MIERTFKLKCRERLSRVFCEGLKLVQTRAGSVSQGRAQIDLNMVRLRENESNSDTGSRDGQINKPGARKMREKYDERPADTATFSTVNNDRPRLTTICTLPKYNPNHGVKIHTNQACIESQDTCKSTLDAIDNSNFTKVHGSASTTTANGK